MRKPQSVASHQARDAAIIATYEAALAVASNLDLSVLLQRIADLAREVVPSLYSALGVADDSGRITEFFTSGISAEERELLGPIPEGHGLLGELVKHRVPMLVPDIPSHPHSYGFPPNHPPMKTLLGVPILFGSRAIGNLYLTDKLHGALYDQQDLEIIQMLALHAASAIDRAQLYRQLEAAHRAAIAQRDQLLAAEQLKDDFLSLVSHEFRTPLTAIHGGARLLASDNDRIDAETRRELLDDIVTESDRLDRMLANMLSLAAMMAGRLTPSTEPLLLGPFIRKLVQESAARSPDYEFEITIPADLPPAEADAELLSQVMRNLYENAVKYTPGSGRIVTSAASSNGTITLRVSDNGGGIAPEHVTTVFERFRRPGADPGIRGMGLGLYLSRLLIDVQGGKIWAESEGIGKGATFVIEIPVAHDWSMTQDEGNA